jgi:hypothetical protein
MTYWRKLLAPHCVQANELADALTTLAQAQSQSRFRYPHHSDSIPQNPSCRAGFGM